MPKFRSAPSRRRAPSPTAKWLVAGPTAASQIQYGHQSTLILPVKVNHHRRRFHDGQRLSVKGFVGGSTLCHVIVTSANRVQLKDVDYPTVRALGHIRVDEFRMAWVTEHDPGYDGPDILERFDHRHGNRDVWLLTFTVDRTDRGGLMAARSEEGYTDSPARALSEEMPAVIGDAWEFHIGRPAREREAARLAGITTERLALGTHERANAARSTARIKGLDVRDEFRLYDRLAQSGRAAEALKQLELIESRVFPQRKAA